MEYRVITDGGYGHDGDLAALENKVASFVGNGWKPVGGICAVSENTGHGIHTKYLQALVREDKKPFWKTLLGVQP